MDRLLAILARAGRIDRRYIFAAILLAVAAPFLFPLDMRAVPSEETLRFDRELARAIDSPKPVLVAVDFGPQTMAEMEPILLAISHRLFSAGKRVVFLTFMTESSALLRRYLSEMEKRYGLTYGKDYVFLGYAAAYFVAIYAMGSSIKEYFHADDRGTPIEQIPLMREVKKLGDVSAVINVASNVMPQSWITWGVAPFGIDLLVACTAIQATDYFPYLQTGQIKGIIAGGRAGAEYEALLVTKGVLPSTGDATRGLGSESLAILAIIAFIGLGNVGFFAGRVLERRRPD